MAGPLAGLLTLAMAGCPAAPADPSICHGEYEPLRGCVPGAQPPAGATLGGPPDAGPSSQPGSGPPAGGCATNGIGSRCAVPDGMQANCGRGLVCTGVSALNLCTQLGCDPSNPLSCGRNSAGIGNVCLGTSTADSLCLPGCQIESVGPDPAMCGGACGRPDFTCLRVPLLDGGTVSACLPDCRTQGNDCAVNRFGGYGTTCDAMTGQCLPGADCSSAPCPAGQVCWAGDSVPSARKTCVADCRVASSNGCPGGRLCNPSTGACDPAPGGALCQSTQDCGPDGMCVFFAQGMTEGECLKLCASDADCSGPGSAGRCDLNLADQLVCEPPACVPPDGGTGADGSTLSSCAPGEVCQLIQLPEDGGVRDSPVCVPAE